MGGCRVSWAFVPRCKAPPEPTIQCLIPASVLTAVKGVGCLLSCYYLPQTLVVRNKWQFAGKYLLQNAIYTHVNDNYLVQQETAGFV